MSKFRIAVLVLICILICVMIYVSLGVVYGTINPLLGLFTVLFLWGSWRVIFRSRGWTNRFQCLGFLLCMFAVCYGVAFYQSYINYEAWKQELIKQHPIYGTVYVTWKPFLATKTGNYLMLAGLGLFCLWVLLFAVSDKFCEPELTTLEARHRLALIEGQKENKEGDEKMTSKRKNAEKELSFWKIGGLILELFALPILIMDAVLLNMPDIDRSTTGILLLIGICLFFSGLILSHLPSQNEKEKEI